MREKYAASVIPINCLSLSEDEIREILGSVLYEFPVKKMEITLPGWLSGMPADAPLKNDLMQYVRTIGGNTHKMKEVNRFVQDLREFAPVTYSESDSVALGEGSAYITAEIDRSLFYGMISDITGFEIGDDINLITALKDLAETQKRFRRIEAALEQVNSTGYGIVMPSIEEMELEEPEIMRQGSRYGVRLKASAPSIHMLRADIQTEVAPIVGSEKQSEDLVKYLLDGFREDPSKLWESNIFGKSLDDLVNEGLKAKLMHMPNEARMKLQQTLERVINEGCNGLICIII
jgi:stage IV sporulation protein A